MKTFTDAAGAAWIATAAEEQTPRHHGRWYLVFHPQAERDRALPMPEVRWQTRATAERTLHTMSTFELRRRLQTILGRVGRQGSPVEATATTAVPDRTRTSASAG